jgi:hypothetical protein
MTTDLETEQARQLCLRTVVEKMLAERTAPLTHATVALRCEREFPGYDYQQKLGDDFRSVIDDTIPEDKAATVDAVTTIATDIVETADSADTPIGISTDQTNTPSEPKMDIEELRARIHEAEMERGATRSQLYAAAQTRTIARTILSESLTAFLTGRPKISATQLAQSFCQGAAADRQAAKDVGRGAHPAHAVHHRSKLDQTLAYFSGGDAGDRVRATMRHGHRRGAVSQAVASDLNQRRTLAAVAAAKLAR